MRLKSIDLLKGILILLVIVGHIIQGPVSDNILRYTIYSFHMPVFIGISGYLLNTSKNASLSFRDLVSKYFFRVIIPWLIALLVYLLFNKHNITLSWLYKQSVLAFLNQLVSPFYHLWFVPAFLSWILITWAAKKMKMPDKTLLLLSALISVLFYIPEKYSALYQHIPVLNKYLGIVLHTLRPYFFVFFILGNYIRHNSIRVGVNSNIIVTLLLFAATLLLFFFPNTAASILLFFLFNISLLILVLTSAQKDQLPHSTPIEWIGTNSFGFYLWHVIPILLIKQVVGTANPILFYIWAIVALALFSILMTQLVKVKIINKYLFGIG